MKNNRYRLSLILLILILAVVACGRRDKAAEEKAAAETQAAEEAALAPTATPTPRPTDTLVPTNTPAPTNTPTATATPEPPPSPTPQPLGLSRSNPFPMSGVAMTPNWEVEVLETLRGQAAADAIQAAHRFNEPPPEGQEYLLVRLRVKNTYGDGGEHSISGADFKVTGDRLIAYSRTSVVEPEPKLDARLFDDGTTEGWSTYLITAGEGNLILVVDEIRNFNEDAVRYIALEEGASLTVPPDLAAIQPTDLGIERTDPAPRSQPVVAGGWELSVSQVVRGDAAWEMVQEANQFNEPPGPGREYVAVQIHVRNVSSEDRAASIDSAYFKTTGDENVAYETPVLSDPSPALDVELYPGGEYEGWVVLQAGQDESGLRLIFDPPLDMTKESQRFISLEE